MHELISVVVFYINCLYQWHFKTYSRAAIKRFINEKEVRKPEAPVRNSNPGTNKNDVFPLWLR